ncbi:AAA family ATPase [Microbacterium memoriense]|uniref:AAA family ATPase n=1 Tax=Microbacterium memoriense TaxID=2978350 RepID=UPI0038995110
MDHGNAPIVGRADERNRLGAALASAQNHQATVLVLVGDPGIGKTALIGDFLDNEWPFRLRTLRVDGFAAEADLPYAGIDRLVLDLHDQIASLPEGLARAQRGNRSVGGSASRPISGRFGAPLTIGRYRRARGVRCR